MSAILIGSPGFCKARSKRAWSAYSPFTEMFNLHLPSRDCTPCLLFPKQLRVRATNVVGIDLGGIARAAVPVLGGSDLPDGAGERARRRNRRDIRIDAGAERGKVDSE